MKFPFALLKNPFFQKGVLKNLPKNFSVES